MSRAHRSAPPVLLLTLFVTFLTASPTISPRFAQAGDVCPDLVATYTYDAVVGDFDRDGFDDIAVSGDPPRLAIFFGQAGPRPTRPGGVILTGAVWRYLATGDLNGDGALDLLGASTVSEYIRVLLGDGHGSFTFGDIVPGAGQMAPGDFNGDSHLDVAVARSGSITVLQGDGAGGLHASQELTVGSPIGDFAAGDVNGDGRADLAVITQDTSINHQALQIYLGNTDGTLTAMPRLETTFNLTAIALGDMNEDGRLDAVVACGLTPPSIVVVFAGQGDGTFAAGPPIATTQGGGGGVRIGDVDADGHQDVVTILGPAIFFGSCNGGGVTLHRGAGDGTLGPPAVTTTSQTTMALALGNVNGDSHPDAVIAECGFLIVHPGGPGGLETLRNEARAFTTKNNDLIRLNSNKAAWCVHIEPVGWDLSDHFLSSITLVSAGTGSQPTASAQPKGWVLGDADGNQIPDVQICFPKDQLRLLFSSLNGRRTVNVQIEGTVSLTGCRFRAPLTVDVLTGGGGNAAAELRPGLFSSEAFLSFVRSHGGHERVRVFDAAGRQVRANGRALPSGVYFYRIDSASDSESGRIVIVK
jgi:hypothetical protein